MDHQFIPSQRGQEGDFDSFHYLSKSLRLKTAIFHKLETRQSNIFIQGFKHMVMVSTDVTELQISQQFEVQMSEFGFYNL